MSKAVNSKQKVGYDRQSLKIRARKDIVVPSDSRSTPRLAGDIGRRPGTKLALRGQLKSLWYRSVCTGRDVLLRVMIVMVNWCEALCLTHVER